MSTAPAFARGQVWWVEGPGYGRRPAAILTRQEAISILPRLLIAPATTHVRNLPTEVFLSKVEDGVPRDCVLTLDDPELAYRSYFVEYITTLGHGRMLDVCRALGAATEC